MQRFLRFLARRAWHGAYPGQALSSDDPRQDRALPPFAEKPILLEYYYLSGQLEARLAEFVDHYNLRRYHESLNNLPPPTSTSAGAKPF